MYDTTNGNIVRAGYVIPAQSANPIALGDQGLWFDGTTLWWVSSDGNKWPTGPYQTAAKTPVRACSAAALAANAYDATAKTLTANANGAMAAVDGVALAVGDRVLLKDEVAGSHNGIYVVTSLGGASAKYVLTRADDFYVSAHMQGGTKVAISEGTANGDKTATLTTNDPITLDTTALVFAVA